MGLIRKNTMALANQLYYLQEFNFRNCELLGTLKTSVTFFGYKQAKMSLNNTFLNAQPDNKFCLKKKIGRARVRTSVWVPDHAKPYQKKNEKQKKNTVKSQAVTSVGLRSSYLKLHSKSNLVLV